MILLNPACIYYTWFQLQTGNMVSYTLSGSYIPRAGCEGNIQSRPYYLSGAEIIFLSYSKSYIKRHFNRDVAMVISSFFIFCRNWKLFCTIKKMTPKNGLLIMNKPETTSIQQILNIKYVEAREIFPTFENCTGKTCYDVKNNGFSWRRSEVSLMSRAPYILRLQVSPYIHINVLLYT